jgi:hypothetical protein
MKGIHFFFFGAGLDIIALIVAFYFMLIDLNSQSGGTNNPTMFKAVFAMIALLCLAFWLKSAGYLTIATILVWVPGFPLFCYGLMILAFVIFKPKI